MEQDSFMSTNIPTIASNSSHIPQPVLSIRELFQTLGQIIPDVSGNNATILK